MKKAQEKEEINQIKQDLLEQLLEQGKIGSWNFGDWRGGVIIVGGGDISDQVCWYTFQNSGIIYTCSVEENIILEIFITQNQYDINGHPVMLDKEFKEIKN